MWGGECGTAVARTSSRNFTLSSSPLWGAVWVAHKPGSFLKPPVPPVQHEVRVLDEPWQPQPAMTISRSQSPLPPVDWKTYTASGRKLRPPASSPTPRSEGGAGAGVLGETTPFLRYRGGRAGPLSSFEPTFSEGTPPQDKGNESLGSSHTPTRTLVFRTKKKAPSTFGII